MRVLFATAELAPLVRVGGLAEAASGLVLALRRAGIEVDVVVPDYFGSGDGGTVLAEERGEHVDVPEWVGGARARTGTLAGFGTVTLVDVPGMARPHPYLQPGTSDGWWDNDKRFYGFSAAIAALARARQADVLHLNDWHTGAAAAFIDRALPIVMSIHNLAYQGQSDPGWMRVLGPHAWAYDWFGGTNPMAGALKLADRIVAVSPRYAQEILTTDLGCGFDGLLRERGADVLGILNGIDHEAWDPASDPLLSANFKAADVTVCEAPGKILCRSALRAELGLRDSNGPLIGFVTRLVDQKGVDLAIEAASFLRSFDGQLVVLGAGDHGLAEGMRMLASRMHDRVSFHEAFDLGLAHRIFAGSDLYLMPSRFEPCGLAQMQAMAYGSLPVVTDVGGLHDTVVDADVDPMEGTGFVSPVVSGAGVVDALHRAARAWSHLDRRLPLVRNAMSIDWSWTGPARAYVELYKTVLHEHGR